MYIDLSMHIISHICIHRNDIHRYNFVFGAPSKGLHFASKVRGVLPTDLEDKNKTRELHCVNLGQGTELVPHFTVPLHPDPGCKGKLSTQKLDPLPLF